MTQQGMNYYTDFPQYVSNSALGDLDKALGVKEDRTKNLQQIFDEGNLVDAMVLEREKLVPEMYALNEESAGRLIEFTPEIWQRSVNMQIALDADPVVSLVKQQGLPQHIIFREKFPFIWEGDTVYMKTRCKYDLLNKKQRVALDIKTTGCTSQKSFVDSMLTFSYFRQGAFYMDMGRVDRMWYVAVCKKPNRYGKHEVYKFAIQRGDPNYLWGYNEYCKLGYKYHLLIY